MVGATALRCLAACVLGLHLAAGLPKKDELMFESRDDTAVVESTVRMARAAPKHIDDLLKPGVKDAYLHVYGDKENEGGDLHGYTKKMNDKGADGYKHFDTFHKKDGDKYGYETHSEYGQGNKADYDSQGGKGKKGSKKGNRGEESQNSYKVADESEDKQGKYAIEDVGYYDEGDGADDGFYPKDDGEKSYEESSSYHTSKKTGDEDGDDGESYHESDEGSYESGSESDDAEDGKGEDDDD